MPFIYVEVIEGLFTPEQKRQIVERLTDAMVAVTGESLRGVTACVVDEVELSTGYVHAALAGGLGAPAPA
jgi:4-oxalocrotonate tautomerase family enzyme